MTSKLTMLYFLLIYKVLKGHNAAILHVAINHADGHILSFSKDMVEYLYYVMCIILVTYTGVTCMDYTRSTVFTDLPSVSTIRKPYFLCFLLPCCYSYSPSGS